jgi:HAD superfamily hydrolase (TIGR01509 family)
VSKGDAGIRLVVFDLGRVLVRICDDWSHACRCAGVALPTSAPDPASRKALDALARQADLGELTIAQFAQAASPLMGLTPAQIQATSDAYLLGAYRGAAELIEALHERGIATACLSNTNESHWQLMADPSHAAHFPLHRLTHRFASHLTKFRKPDPAIYAYVERATGIAPGAILFFDDLMENVEAARARGWHARRVDPAPNDPLPQIRAGLLEHGITPAATG